MFWAAKQKCITEVKTISIPIYEKSLNLNKNDSSPIHSGEPGFKLHSCTSSAGPGQPWACCPTRGSSTPWFVSRSWQIRVRRFQPPSSDRGPVNRQSGSQSDHSVHSDHEVYGTGPIGPPEPGQATELPGRLTSHVRTSLAEPGHSRPPYCGAGWLHSRSRVWSPIPQVREHEDQEDQLDHSPWTAQHVDDVGGDFGEE